MASSSSDSKKRRSSNKNNNDLNNSNSSRWLLVFVILFILGLLLLVWFAIIPFVYCDDDGTTDGTDSTYYYDSSTTSDGTSATSYTSATSGTSGTSGTTDTHHDSNHHHHHKRVCWHKFWSWSTGHHDSSSSSSTTDIETSPDQTDFVLAGAETSSVTSSQSTITTSDLGEDYTSLPSESDLSSELFEDNYYTRSRKVGDPRVPQGHPGTRSWPRTIEQNNLRLDSTGGSGSYMPRYSTIVGPGCGDTPVDQDDLNAIRGVSNSLFQQGDSTDYLNNFHAEDVKDTNALFVFFGQFVDHVLVLSKSGAEPLEIDITDDSYIDGGDATIHLTRNAYIMIDNCRHPINRNSAFMDLSTVYGSNEDTARNLRTHEHGLMKMTIVEGEELPPFQSGSTDEAALGETSGQIRFFTGDPRGSEIPALTAIHTMFLRNHNRIARKIRDSHHAKGWTDEQLYQRSKIINIWTFQRILYREWLPLLLGDDVIELVSGGYESNYDPLVRVESSILFRFGHDMLPQKLHAVTYPYFDNSPDIHYSAFDLRGTFFRSDMVVQYGADGFLLGSMTQEAQKVDGFITDDVRSFLFNGLPLENTLFDLPAITLARSLELGVPDCNTFRNSIGLASHTDFTPFGSRAGDVSGVYGTIDEVPLFVCGIFEQHVADALVGETIHDTILDQFVRIAIGDPMFYLYVPMTDFERSIVFGEEGTMSGILKHNTQIGVLAPHCVEENDNVFIMNPCSS